MECRCRQATEFRGEEAELYAADHLVAEATAGGTGQTFACPDTGKRWRLTQENDQPVLSEA